MRPFIDSFCALAGVLLLSAAACASDRPTDIHVRPDKAKLNIRASITP